MYATERHSLIIGELGERGRVSVASLSRDLDVTQETIRRDLDALEEAGALRRVHGGAVRRAAAVELGLRERTERNTPAKRAIAQAAMGLLRSAAPAAIAVDAGSTTGAFADLLADLPEGGRPVDVVTNAVPIVLRLQDSRALTVHAAGGVVRPETSATVGAAAIEAFGRIRCDLAFLGANGVAPVLGLSTPDEREAAVKTAMVRSARRTVALVDATKHGEESFLRFADLDEIDVLVTDRAPTGALAAALARAGVETLVA